MKVCKYRQHTEGDLTGSTCPQHFSLGYTNAQIQIHKQKNTNTELQRYKNINAPLDAQCINTNTKKVDLPAKHSSLESPTFKESLHSDNLSKCSSSMKTSPKRIPLHRRPSQPTSCHPPSCQRPSRAQPKVGHTSLKEIILS